MRVLPVLLAALLLGGCLGTPDEVAPAATVAATPLSASLPQMTKLVVAAETETIPLDEILGRPREQTRAFDVAGPASRLQLALDITSTLAEARRAEDEVRVEVRDPSGDVVLETPVTREPTKLLLDVADPEPGAWTLFVASRGLGWEVGLVATAFPTDYTPGAVLFVAEPGETEITHTFHPGEIVVGAGQRARITLFDYDPHPGVQNLQHNVYIPDLGVRTEGRTTWGEVRVLDFDAPAQPGEYPFYCEFHERQLRGVLVVA